MPKLWVSAAETVHGEGLVAEQAVEFASYILYKLTGERYPGVGTSTDTYVLDENRTFALYDPTVVNGKIVRFPETQFKGLTELNLRGTPIVSVESLAVNGVVVPRDQFHIVNHRYLVRKDRASWVSKPGDEIEVTYRHGSPPPRAGRMAALRLANEIIWADTDDPRCSLPERVTSVTRQGITMAVLDPQDFLENGKTGIYVVDSFIKAANPNNAKKKPKVYSPDKPFGERRY